MKKFVAMYAEVGEFIKSNPRILGVFDTKEDAESEIIKDMYGWVESMKADDDDYFCSKESIVRWRYLDSLLKEK